MSEYTPGPWQYHRRVISDLNGENICEMCGSAFHARHQADAHLIAAAPDLLEALKEAGNIIHSEFCTEKHHPNCIAVDAVIAKAEGN